MQRHSIAAVTGAVAATVAVAACGGKDHKGGGGASSSAKTSSAVAIKPGKPGGKLTVLWAADVDFLDPGLTYCLGWFGQVALACTNRARASAARLAAPGLGALTTMNPSARRRHTQSAHECPPRLIDRRGRSHSAVTHLAHFPNPVQAGAEASLARRPHRTTSTRQSNAALAFASRASESVVTSAEHT